MAISGYIRLKDNTTITVADENIVSNSLSVQMSACRNTSYALGTFNAALMKIGVIDEDAASRDFTDAEIVLQKEIEGEDPIKLGRYYVDGAKTDRRKHEVLLTAQDGSAVFDSELPAAVHSTEYNSAYDALLAVCTAVGIALITTDLSGFPNYDVHIKPTSAAIQTHRDLVMWICQLLAAHAILNRDGALEIRHARRNVGATEDLINEASERTDIKFSDGRLYVKYMTAYSAGKVKTYQNNTAFQDPAAKPGTLSLSWNPLLDGMNETDCDTINLAILNDLRLFMQRQITAKLFDDPTVALDMAVRFRGGKIDNRLSIIGMVTAVTWRYHGDTTVTCAAMPAVKDEVSA